MPDSSDGPTVLRILLGSHLRRLREARGITARQAASKIRASESKISRIELGRNAIREWRAGTVSFARGAARPYRKITER